MQARGTCMWKQKHPLPSSVNEYCKSPRAIKAYSQQSGRISVSTQASCEYIILKEARPLLMTVVCFLCCSCLRRTTRWMPLVLVFRPQVVNTNKDAPVNTWRSRSVHRPPLKNPLWCAGELIGSRTLQINLYVTLNYEACCCNTMWVYGGWGYWKKMAGPNNNSLSWQFFINRLWPGFWR